MKPNGPGPTPSLLASLVLAASQPVQGASVLWETQLDAPGAVSHVRAAAADVAGDFIVTGHFVIGSTTQCRTAKFAGATGAVLWQRTQAMAGPRCEAASLALDAAGNAIVASRSHTLEGAVTGSRTTKYAAASGATLWEKTFGDPADGADELTAIAADAAGNVIVTGRFVAGGDAEWRTIKYAAADGAILWERAYERGMPGDDIPEALALDAAGNAVVAGSSRPGFPAEDLVTVKYDGATGAPLWARLYPAPAFTTVNHVSGIAVDGEGNALVLGGIQADSSALRAVLVTLKYAASDGALLWSAVLDDVIQNEFGKYGMIATGPAGDVTVAGTKWGTARGGDYDFRTVRYAGATGAATWTRVLHRGTEYANALALDGAGNPVVTGIGGPGTAPEFATVKYRAADGEVAWEHWYGGAGIGAGSSRAVATVPGAVFLAGNLEVPGSGPRWQVMKISDEPGPPRRVRHDFDADGHGDFAFRHADGTTGIWLMDGAATASIAGIFDAGSGFEIVAVDDFDGNGTADLLWRLPEGYAVSLMDGATFTATAGLLGAGSGWRPALTGDFDGDGKADIALVHDDGTLVVAIMDGTTVSRGFIVLAAGSGWAPVRAGDFDGDGKSDLLLRRSDNAHVIALVDGFGVSSSAMLPGSNGASVVQLADFNGDGNSDILWKSPDGFHAVWILRGTAVNGAGGVLVAGSGWSAPLAADFDGDGRADLLVVHEDGRVGLIPMRGSEKDPGAGILGPGSGWSVVAARDTDGDGRADLLLRHADGVYAIGLVKNLAMPTAAGVVGPPWELSP
ncbi:MAG: FG-GAP repeat domain-containing protein [Vicinamibacterales bacterium]